MNPKSKYNKYFQWSMQKKLSYRKKEHLKQTMVPKKIVDQCNQKGIIYPSEIKDWKKFELNNLEIFLNVLFGKHNQEEIRQAYISKYKSERKNEVTLSMISDDKKWHYITVTKQSPDLEE